MKTIQAVGLPDQAEPESNQTSWPLGQSERSWSPWKLTMVLTVTACATWCYIIGEYVGYYLNLKMGTAALVAGGMLGMLIVTLAVVPIVTRFGVDSVTGTVPQFGSKGWVITLLPQFASILGWNAILLIFFGKNVAQLLQLMGMSDGVVSAAAPVISIASCLICYLVLLKGSTGLEKVSSVLFFFIIGVGAWMIFLLVTEQSAAIAAAKPAYASESLSWNYVTGMEIAIASNLSWWAYAGAMMRQSKNAHSATLPAMLGMGLPVPLLSIIGLASVLALQVSDPSKWMVQLGGPLYGSIALVFVAAANFGTILAGVYCSSIGMRQLKVFSKVSWNKLLLIGLLPIMLMALLVPDLVFKNFGTFLAFIGLAFGPICGIQIMDTLVIRKQKVSVRGLFDPSPSAAYYFWSGWNPAAVIAFAAGVGTYLSLLNPLTYASSWPYEVTTASIPTVIVSALVYWLVTVLFVRPAGKGDYIPNTNVR